MIILQNDKLQVQISEDGAELRSVKGEREYMFNADPTYWPRTAPVLFPIVGQLKDNKYSYKGETYELPRHGFARDRKFTLLEQTDNYASFMLTSDEESLKVYPFEFSLIIDYTLKDNEIKVTYKVVNLGEEEMYYSIGAHPAFSIDDDTNDYKIGLTKTTDEFELTVDGTVNEQFANEIENVTYTKTLFDDDAIVFGFKEDEEKTAIIYENDKPYIVMDFDELGLIGLWSVPKKDAPFICLEPWNGVADFESREDNDITNKDYINKIDVDSSDVTSYTIKFN